MGCGMATNYAQLAVARMTVGVGEAGGVPPSYAIIADYFPSGRRGTALGIYNLGPPIGAALGIAFGASIAAAFSWRYAFIILGGAGILTAIAFILSVREPRRGGLDDITQTPTGNFGARTSGFVDTLRMFFSHPALLLAALGSGATQVITYGLGNFTTLFLMREKGMTLSEIALYYALIVWHRHGRGDIRFRMDGRPLHTPLQTSLRAASCGRRWSLAAPLFVGFVWAPTWPCRTAFPDRYRRSSTTSICLPRSRWFRRKSVRSSACMSGALLLLVMNFIGLGLGPTYRRCCQRLFPRHATRNIPCRLRCTHSCRFTFSPIFLFLWLARVLRREDREP